MTANEKLENAFDFFDELENVDFLGEKNFCELPYLQGIFKNLIYKRGFNKYHFYIHDHHKSIPVANKNIITIYLSNEDHRIPGYVNDVYKVFTPYAALKNRPENLKAIPLGYNGDIPEFTPKSLNERNIDIFFSGRLSNSRKFMANAVDHLSKIYHDLNWEINYTRQFRSGFSPEKYAAYLHDSKIALVPRGYFSSFSFRLFEALRAGCIVITCPQPEEWFTKNAPWHEIDNWQELKYYINNLSDFIKEGNQFIINYYNNKLREQAVANFISNYL